MPWRTSWWHSGKSSLTSPPLSLLVDKHLANIALLREEQLLRLWMGQHSQLFNPQPLQRMVSRDSTLPGGMEEIMRSRGLRLFRRRKSLTRMARHSLMIWESDPWKSLRGRKGAREPHLHFLLQMWGPSMGMVNKFTLSIREKTRRGKQ